MKFLHAIFVFTLLFSAPQIDAKRFAPEQQEPLIPKGCYPTLREFLKLLRLVLPHR